MTQPYPFRLAVSIGITNLLKTITPANGYQNDLSDYVNSVTAEPMKRVFRGRNIFGYDDPMPMVALLQNPHAEQSMQRDGVNSGVNLGPKDFLIQGFVENDPENPTDLAEILLADVQQCLALHKQSQAGQVRRTYFGITANGTSGISDFHIGAGIARPSDDISPYAYFWLILSVELGEDMANPFAWT